MLGGEINLHDGDPATVKSPTETGSRKAKEDEAPLSKIIQVLNDRFGTDFTEADRYFFEQIREKAANTDHVIKLRQANPLDHFRLGLRDLVAELMVQRMTDNDAIVTKYMNDKEFGEAAFNVLSKVIYNSIPVG
jgi:type I restriction enzyme R subunit